MSIVHFHQNSKSTALGTGVKYEGTIFLLLLASYFLLHVLIRINLSDSLDLDEAEAVLMSQELQAGNGTQPPLYSWLQWLMFQAFGLNLFALSALKNLLLFITYTGLFCLARPMIGTRGAMAASASLLLLPQISWESQRDLTHSVLLTAVACATLCSYFALLRKPDAARYAAFGLLVGLGLQTKYNFAMFVAGLACASLLVKEHRAILWNRRLGISLAVAVLVLLPHGAWLLDNLDAASSGTLQKMADGARDAGYFRNVATGMASMLTAALAFVTLCAAVYAFAGRRYWKQATPDWRSPQARFFLGLYASFLALLICIVLTGEVGKIKDRWMQPLLFSMPLAFFLLLPAMAQDAVYRRILRVAAVVALIILLAIPLRVVLGPVFDKHVRAHHPYPELAAELSRRFPQVRTLVSDEKQIAGNLLFQRPALQTLMPEQALKRPGTLQGDVLLVTFSDVRSDLPQRLRAAYPGSTIRNVDQISLQLRYGSRKSMSFDVVHLTIGKP